ncbi:hypothetical protein [Polaribacter sp.]|uniref:hypothetical protein n=1 Tax=Polaribacter sp. TaxID=1920175 RepID=UPI004048B73B
MKDNLNDVFNDFQLEEYKNISNSHFESVKQVSIFFRYYLLILGAPILLLNLIQNKENGLNDFFEGNSNSIFYDISFYYFTSISLIGFFVYIYIINIRLDALLYARTVNKTRRYFYEKSSLLIEDFDSFLNLPITASKPKYFESSFFIPLLSVFAIINCGFLVCGFCMKVLKSNYLINWEYFDFPITKPKIILLTATFFLLHWFVYYLLSNLKNNYYLKYYRIGVDIDGVLNNQTDHFIKYLRKITDIEISAKSIKELPVHLNKNIGVSLKDEKCVFNAKEYWENLKIRPNTSLRINEFQKRFGYKILFFSYRDWPQYENEIEKKEIETIIKNAGFTPLKNNEIISITKEWLKKNGIEVVLSNGFLNRVKSFFKNFVFSNKTLTIEMGNPYISDNRFFNFTNKSIRNNNRFQSASINGFRFFVDDTPENAIKLSNLCDYVFLFEEPYNKDVLMPKNVIRVKSWNDIYRHLKKLG